jgi:hypothetical protein
MADPPTWNRECPCGEVLHVLTSCVSPAELLGQGQEASLLDREPGDLVVEYGGGVGVPRFEDVACPKGEAGLPRSRAT